MQPTIKISDSLTKELAQNYDTRCQTYTKKFLPLSIASQLAEKKGTSTTSEICDPDINESVLGYNMDLSIPTFKIYQGDLSCEKVGFWKWLFDIKSDNIGYAFKGIKVWFIALPLGIYLAILGIRIIRRIFNISSGNKKAKTRNIIILAT